jgi:hypothetical protein
MAASAEVMMNFQDFKGFLELAFEFGVRVRDHGMGQSVSQEDCVDGRLLERKTPSFVP